MDLVSTHGKINLMLQAKVYELLRLMIAFNGYDDDLPLACAQLTGMLSSKLITR